MQRKLTGGRSWLVVGLAAGVMTLPLSLAAVNASSPLQLQTAMLTAEELRTAFASTTATPTGQRRVQVGPRDTLWSIARTTRPNNNITIKQAMLAIRDANPRAFPSGNINEMESGSTLVIPTAAAMMRRTALQAEQEVRRQNQAWVASRDQAPSRPAPVADIRPTPRPPMDTAPAAAPERPETRPRDLQLVTPPASTAQQERINQLEGRLSASEESLQLAEREKDELAERITEMQQQVNTLQQLIRLKDEQLVDMERQLTQRATQSGAMTTPPPAVQAQPAAPAEVMPQDLMSRIQQQPGLYGALGGSLLLLLALFFAWLSARSQLKAARKQNALAPAETNLEADMLAAHNATSSDFDLDLNAQPLDELEGLDDLDQLELDDEGLSADLDSSDLDLDDLDTALETDFEPEEKQPVARKEKQRDALQEAEMFIAYGRLEQAAGYLQSALVEQPEREDLRLKLLEVLVELNDEETFNKQRAELEAGSPSAAAGRRVAELAALFVAAAPVQSLAEDKFDAGRDNALDEDLGEMDLGDLADLDDLDLELDDDQAIADIFGSEEPEATSRSEQPAPSSIEMDFGVDDDQSDLEDIPQLGGLEDFDDLDSLEAELDEVISSKPPVEPTPEEDLVDPLEGLEELDESEAEELDLELDLEKPIEANELDDDFGVSNDFEPVDYKSDADDFMSALDSLELDDIPETEEQGVVEQKQAPGVNEELAALSSDLSELESLTADLDEAPATDDNDLLDLSDLGDLGDLDDLDIGGAEGDLTTQLDLATAYIEMGDKEGARELLDKVIREGDADLRATAQQMLEALTG